MSEEHHEFHLHSEWTDNSDGDGLIRLRPRISTTGWNETQQQTALDLAHKAEQYCVISNALRGNVDISVIPEIYADCLRCG